MLVEKEQQLQQLRRSSPDDDASGDRDQTTPSAGGDKQLTPCVPSAAAKDGSMTSIAAHEGQGTPEGSVAMTSSPSPFPQHGVSEMEGPGLGLDEEKASATSQAGGSPVGDAHPPSSRRAPRAAAGGRSCSWFQEFSASPDGSVPDDWPHGESPSSSPSQDSAFDHPAAALTAAFPTARLVRMSNAGPQRHQEGRLRPVADNGSGHRPMRGARDLDRRQSRVPPHDEETGGLDAAMDAAAEQAVSSLYDDLTAQYHNGQPLADRGSPSSSGSDSGGSPWCMPLMYNSGVGHEGSAMRSWGPVGGSRAAPGAAPRQADPAHGSRASAFFPAANSSLKEGSNGVQQFPRASRGRQQQPRKVECDEEANADSGLIRGIKGRLESLRATFGILPPSGSPSSGFDASSSSGFDAAAEVVKSNGLPGPRPGEARQRLHGGGPVVHSGAGHGRASGSDVPLTAQAVRVGEAQHRAMQREGGGHPGDVWGAYGLASAPRSFGPEAVAAAESLVPSAAAVIAAQQQRRRSAIAHAPRAFTVVGSGEFGP